MALAGDLQSQALTQNKWVEIPIGPRRIKKAFFANYNAAGKIFLRMKGGGDPTNARGILLTVTAPQNTFTDQTPAHQGKWWAWTDTIGMVLDYVIWA